MLTRGWLYCCFLVIGLPSLVLGNSANVALMYRPDIYVSHRVTTQVTLEQQLPGLEFTSGIDQTLDVETLILGEEGEETVQAPIDIELLIKRLQLKLRANRSTVIVDSETDRDAPEIAQMRQVLNRPLHFHFDKDYAMNGPTDDLRRLSQDMPTLMTFFNQRFFEDVFRHVFVFAGQEVGAGTKATAQLSIGESSPMPIPIEYEVTVANFKEVEAKIQGEVEKFQTWMDPGFAIQNPDAQGETKVSLEISGYVTGKVRWDRRHAMLHQLQLEHVYDASFQVGDLTWPLRLSIVQRVESRRNLSAYNEG